MSRIYFHTGDDLDGGGSGLEEKALDLVAPGSPSTVTIPGITAAGLIALNLTTPAGEPNSAQWPDPVTGKLDVLSVTAGATLGFLTQGAGVGGLLRMNKDLDVVLESQDQVEAPFSTPGLKTVTFSTAWAAGSLDDRIQGRLAAMDSGGPPGTIGFTFDGDGFFEGAWTSPLAGIKQLSARIVSGTLGETGDRSLRFRQGDEGIEVRLLTVAVDDDGVEAPVDIEPAILKNFVWVGPDGVERVRAAAFLTDGHDGLTTYTIAAEDFDVPGSWRLFLHLTRAAPSRDLYSEPIQVQIDPTFGRSGGV